MARPVTQISDERRKEIQQLSGYGLTIEQIANVLGIDRNTLAKHCKEDLEKGKADALKFAVTSLFSNIKKGKEASLIFYLKTQHRWKEVTQTELTGANGTQLIPSVNVTLKRGNEVS